jgi:uncharacterized SAM-binding protein YcdF (DUF218 family)
MNEIDNLAKIIWNYMVLNQTLKKADVILALGSNDIRVADRAAELYKKGYAPYIICSGGIAHTNDINATGWDKSEAVVYKNHLLELGVPEEKIILEVDSKNCQENVLFTKKLIHDRNLNFKKLILVQKPWMERRMYATFRKNWPELSFTITSPLLSYEKYMDSSKKEIFLNVMVGDFQRIKEYPKYGFQIEQEIPDKVWQAGQKLIGLGYDKYLLKKTSNL